MVATEAVAVHLSSEAWDLRPVEPTELRGIVEPVAAFVVERRPPSA